jgi:hypothetical protein
VSRAEWTSPTYLARYPYGPNGEPQTYVTPWRKTLDAEGAVDWVPVPVYRRWAEVRLGLYVPLNVRVFSGELALRPSIGHWVLDASWNRFVEPLPGAPADSLDLVRLKLGGNVFGGSVQGIELYPLVGGVFFRGPTVTTGGVDMGIDLRTYPIEPLTVSTTLAALVFAQGRPLFDLRVEGGFTLGRMDVRIGLRYLKQEPAESFFGPTAGLVVRL